MRSGITKFDLIDNDIVSILTENVDKNYVHYQDKCYEIPSELYSYNYDKTTNKLLLETNNLIYEIDFNATISSAIVGVVAFALFNNGEQIPGTLMAETLATAGDYANIGINKKIKVCCSGNSNISVRAIPVVPTATDPTTPIETQVPIIASANFSITKKA